MIRSIQSKRDRDGRSTHRTARLVDVADQTGPLDTLAGKRVAALFDIENLLGGARDLGLSLDFARLADHLQTAARSIRLHAVFSRQPGDTRLQEELEEAGFVAHPRDIEVVQTHNGTRTRANSDEKILFLAGRYMTRGSIDVVLFGSGDGDLVTELAACFSELATSRSVCTLSLAGSTSYRLNAARTEQIDANLEIGMDSLKESVAATPRRNSRRGPRSRGHRQKASLCHD